MNKGNTGCNLLCFERLICLGLHGSFNSPRKMRESADAGSRIFYEAMNAVVGIFLIRLFALFDDQVDQREFAGLNGPVGALDCGWDL